MSLTPDRPDLSRRELLRRAAALGILATPAAGFLSACATSGTGETQSQEEGEKTDKNPLGVKEDAQLEIVIFNGGYGEKYATDIHEPMYKKLYPKATIKHASTQEIAKTLRPRFASGNPPDFVNNSGTDFMDVGALVQDEQLYDLTDLLKAPSLDIPGKTVEETLTPGTVETGTYEGKPLVLNYVFTVYGVWYSSKLFKSKGWTAPASWTEFTGLLDKIKAAGVIPYGYAGANAAYYQYLVILSSAAKIGGPDVLKNIDNLEDGAWKVDAVKQAAEAWAEIGAKYSDKSFEGLRHTEVQLRQNQDQLAFYPSGSWLENEQKASTPAGFDYNMMPLPSHSDSDKLPTKAIFATAGEPYFVSAKGKNPRGGLEYMRVMLSKQGASEFVKLNGSLTSVAGSADGISLTPGLTSASAALTAAGDDVFNYRWDQWYKPLDEELRNATNALMFGRITADQFVERAQVKADAIKKDDSITKFKR